MENEIEQISYHSMAVEGGPGEAVRILDSLAEAGVKFHSFSAAPQISGSTQLDLVAQDPDALESSAAELNLPLSERKAIFLLRSYNQPASYLDRLMRDDVSIVSVNGALIAGQVDRLLMRPDRVRVLDYKTNRPPPASPERVAPLYLRQMAAYRAVLRQAFPGRAVDCALVWTYGATVMPLPHGLLDAHAPQGVASPA